VRAADAAGWTALHWAAANGADGECAYYSITVLL
jgi:ankyrin repeat protein